ncbi:hypothetical protein SL053_002229 [Flavobacterium psychrophilum]|nr:hypothetical protein [Flavobacterium psychrophilum]
MTEYKELLPFLAIFFSIISLIISFLNYSNSKKSRYISEKQFENRQSNFSLYLNDNYYFIEKKLKYAIFNITILNKSEVKNSFIPSLEITYSQNENLSKIKLSYNKEISKNIENVHYTFFENNIVINEKETTTKWLIFEIPQKLERCVIDKYCVVFKDPHNCTEKISSIILKNLPNEVRN